MLLATSESDSHGDFVFLLVGFLTQSESNVLPSPPSAATTTSFCFSLEEEGFRMFRLLHQTNQVRNFGHGVSISVAVVLFSRVFLNPIDLCRVRKRVKSNEELRNEILEFVASAGLPQGHVPSMKELSAHERFQLS